MFEKINNFRLQKSQHLKAVETVDESKEKTPQDKSYYDGLKAAEQEQQNQLRSYVSRVDLDDLVNPLDGNAQCAESIGIAAFSAETNTLFFKAKNILSSYSAKAYELLYKLFADIKSGQFTQEEILDKVNEFKDKIDKLKDTARDKIGEIQILSDGIIKAAKAADSARTKGTSTFYLADVFGETGKEIKTDATEEEDNSDMKKKVTQNISQLEKKIADLEKKLKRTDLDEIEKSQAVVEYKVDKIALDTMKKLLKSLD